MRNRPCDPKRRGFHFPNHLRPAKQVELCDLVSRLLVRAFIMMVIGTITAQALLLSGWVRQWLTPIERMEGIPYSSQHIDESIMLFHRGAHHRIRR